MLKTTTSCVPCVWRYSSGPWPRSADIRSVTTAFRSVCGPKAQCVPSAGLICASGLKMTIYKTLWRDQSESAKAVKMRFLFLTWEATQEIASNIKTTSRRVWSPFQKTSPPLSVQCRTAPRSPAPTVRSRTLTRTGWLSTAPQNILVKPSPWCVRYVPQCRGVIPITRVQTSFNTSEYDMLFHTIRLWITPQMSKPWSRKPYSALWWKTDVRDTHTLVQHQPKKQQCSCFTKK